MVGSNQVLNISTRRELFVDRLLICELKGTRLKLQEPKHAEIAIDYDTEVEGYSEHPSSFYTTILNDHDTCRMYYRGGSDSERSITCYAESQDGIHWIKPNLNLFEVHGSKHNNVIGFQNAPQFCPFVDNRPDVLPSERYKANALHTNKSDNVGLFGYYSGDGIHWSKLQDEPIVPNVLLNHFDSQNVMFWSNVEQQYVLYARHMVGGKRSTARATSENFVDWTEPVLMTYSDTGTTTPSAHLYTNQTNPYFRAPHIYVSMPGRIFFNRRSLSPDETKRNVMAVDTEAGDANDCSDGVFLTTRAGTNTYDFIFKESFVRPGIGAANWTTRNNYPALGLVQTGPDEMSIYVQRHYAQMTSHLERMTMRLDGFASLNADYNGGEMVTRPIIFDGSELEINYSTSAAGSIRIEIQDQYGSVLPGYSIENSIEMIGDEIEKIAVWQSESDLSNLAGIPIRLRFVMRDSDVYSFRFRSASA